MDRSDPSLRQYASIEERVTWTDGLRWADRAVLKAIARWYAWRPDGTNIRPPSDQLMRKTGLKRRTVERALARLVQDGWLVIETRRNRQSAIYAIALDRLATADPDRLQAVPDLDRQSGGRTDASTARVADETLSTARVADEPDPATFENRPHSEKVADEDPGSLDLYDPKVPGYTHTHADASAPAVLSPEAPSAAPYRHPGHAYCGVKFCVPAFLDEQFAQQSGWAGAELQAAYRTWNADAVKDAVRIGDALKWLRARYRDLVRAQTPAPEPAAQLALGLLEPADPTGAAAARAALAAKAQTARRDAEQAAAAAYDHLDAAARAQLARDAEADLKDYRARVSGDAFAILVQNKMRLYLEDPRVRQHFGVRRQAP